MSDDAFDEFEDELGDEFEDDSVDQALLEEFEKNVSKKMRVLISKRPIAERIEAAYWLGESGSPKAIMALRTVYRREQKSKKNKALVRATQYALGQFKALDEAIERGPGESVSDALGREENAEVLERLTSIALKGQTGKRKRFPAQTLTRVMLGMVGSLVVLMLLTMAVISGGGSDDTDDPTSAATRSPQPTQVAVAVGADSPREVLEQLQSALTTIQTTANTLQAQLSAAGEGDSLDCAVDLTIPAVPAADVDVAPEIDELSANTASIIGNLQVLIDAYSGFCQEGGQPSDNNISLVADGLNRLLRDLEPLQADIATQIDLIDNPPTATPEMTPTPTIEPTITATPIDQRAVDSALTILSRNIDTVLVGRSAYPLLNQYWNDVRNVGNTGGCNNARPTIPEDYTVSQELADAMPELAEIAQQTNLGLQLMRDAWDYFETGCREGNLTELVDNGLNQISTAQNWLSVAQSSIVVMRGG